VGLPSTVRTDFTWQGQGVDRTRHPHRFTGARGSKGAD
jgi:hypothetical protein